MLARSEAECHTAERFGRVAATSIKFKEEPPRTAHPLLCNVNFSPYSKAPVAYVLFGAGKQQTNSSFWATGRGELKG